MLAAATLCSQENETNQITEIETDDRRDENNSRGGAGCTGGRLWRKGGLHTPSWLYDDVV